MNSSQRQPQPSDLPHYACHPQSNTAYLVRRRACSWSFFRYVPSGRERRCHRLHPVAVAAPPGRAERTGRGRWGRPHATGTARPSPSASQRPDPANGAVKTKRSWSSDAHLIHGILYFCVLASIRMGIESKAGKCRGVREKKKREAAKRSEAARAAACADGEVHAQVQGGCGRGGGRRRGYAGRRRPDQVAGRDGGRRSLRRCREAEKGAAAGHGTCCPGFWW
jgi:hypothetical protein